MNFTSNVLILPGLGNSGKTIGKVFGKSSTLILNGLSNTIGKPRFVQTGFDRLTRPY